VANALQQYRATKPGEKTLDEGSEELLLASIYNSKEWNQTKVSLEQFAENQLSRPETLDRSLS
jgi:hypothetical protein